ncbi:MAG: glycosyltransferase family 4 protein [Opitutaceae bacterium]|nr:glycosyltransferase family 4 protein [Cytophagales bacterium]
MRILHTVESYLPLKNGMSEVVRQLSERLVSIGHEVSVVTSYCSSRSEDSINGVTIIPFNIEGNYVKGFKGEFCLYKDFLLQNNFDIITNFAAQQWATDICIELLPQLKAKKVFVPTGFSGLSNPEYNSYFENMRTWMKCYDMNVFLSDNYRDINFARSNHIKNLVLIPNGAAKDEFCVNNQDFNIRKYLNIPDNHKIILHVGSYTDLKGHDQALEIFLKSSVQNASLIFVGANFNENGRYFTQKLNWFKNFSFTDIINRRSLKSLFLFLKNICNKRSGNVFTVSLSRSQTVETFKDADLFLFPSMIECSPIVLFEAMASKTPFLVTDVGNATEIIEWSKGGELLPTAIDESGFSHALIEPSAKLLSNIIEDQVKLNTMSFNGHSRWLSDFTWENIVVRYEMMYKELLK